METIIGSLLPTIFMVILAIAPSAPATSGAPATGMSRRTRITLGIVAAALRPR